MPDKSIIQQAISGARAMRAFAFLDPNSIVVKREAMELAKALRQDENEALAGMKHVIQKHREEWVALLETLDPNSLTRQLGGQYD